MRWIERNWKLFELVAIAVGIVVWAYSTFAAQTEVSSIRQEIKDREVNVRDYVEQKHGGVLNILEKMDQKLDRIDQRVYEMKSRGN